MAAIRLSAGGASTTATLDGRGLIFRAIVNIRPLPNISRPLAEWTPGENEPDFTQISATAKARWRGPSVPHDIFFATPLAANLFGSSSGRLSHLDHRNHDLLLGQVYALFREGRSNEARRWLGKDSVAKAGYRVKEPDAFLVSSAGDTVCAIKATGHYDVARVQSFHDHCVESGLPYEIW